MSSIFTKIIRGEIPCYKVAEDKNYFAFLDINPLAKGHTLVVLKKEVDYIFDLDNKTLSGLHLFAKKVANAIEKNIECKRIGMMVIGTEVPHAHVHLIPFQEESQMSVSAPKLNIGNEEMTSISESIYASFNHKRTLVFGASAKPERYSNKAMKMLKEYGHEIVAIGGKISKAHDTNIQIGHPAITDVHTITMYIGEKRQEEHVEYLLSLNPQRIIFNPGAENPSLQKAAQEKGIEVINACTLVMLRTNQF